MRYLIGAIAVSCLLIALGVRAEGLGSWRTVAPMPMERTEVAAAAVDGKIYVIGGFKMFFIGGVTGAVQAYDPALDRWENRAPLPKPFITWPPST
ncbi:MAG: hypothetical protein M5R38_07920 [Candidatus Methylomirabilis sp.]|nr:hypothetical protein [Candidatus Methylomirabilis sp.]